jgi:Gpi18-like mannosyltransferase
LARPAAIFLASRVVVLAALAVGTTVRSGLDPSQKVTLTAQLQRWDVQWYLEAAAHGYPHSIPTVGGHAAESTIAFFPLFPLLVRATAAVTGVTQFIAGLVLANLFGLVACILLWAIATRVAGSDTETADRSVALFAFFPGAFVLSLPYSEPLMLVLAMASLLCMLDRRWPLAGLFAALATATRPNAIVLVACFAVEALVLLRARHPDRGRALVGTLVAPLGAVAFFAFLAWRTHAIAAWFHVQQGGWHESLSLTANARRIEYVVHHRVQDANIFVTVLGLAVLVVALVYLFLDRQPRPLVVYTLGIAALALFSQTLGPRPRFVLTAFPLFIALGRRLRPLAWSLTMAVSAGLLGVLTILSLAANRVTP